MSEEANAQIAEDALGDGRRQVVVEERHRLDGPARRQIEDRKQEEARGSTDHEVVVDDHANDERRRELEGRGRQHEEGNRGGPGPPGREQAREVCRERARGGWIARAREGHAVHRRAPLVGAASAWSWARKIRA
jgi:hypothetical protein